MERLGIHTEPAKAQLLANPIKFDLAGNTGVTIDSFTNAQGEIVYRVQWVDYVVNEWNEYYATLSLALARVAVLTACVEEEVENQNATLAFVNGSETFSQHAYNFINGEVK